MLCSMNLKRALCLQPAQSFAEMSVAAKLSAVPKSSVFPSSSSASDMGHPTSVLKRLVRESIIAFPDEPHMKILDFLVENGMTEEKTLKFRQCWSKVIMGTQAFGRKKAKDNSISDPDLFADELIRELSYGDRDITNLINMVASGGDEASSSDNPHDIMKSLQHYNSVHKRLGKTIRDLNEAPALGESGVGSAAEDSLLVNQSIALFRNSLKGTKLHWKAHKSTQVAYWPLDQHMHGDPDSYAGHLTLPLSKSEHKELPLFLSTTDLQGLRVSGSQPSHQQLAWSAYQCLSELLASQSLNMFPVPVGVQRDSHSLSVLIGFEALHARPLSSLMGPVLSTYLRKYPNLISLWAGQLAAAHRSLQHHCSGTLLRPFSLARDVFVRENGLLLLGNLAFSDVAPRKSESGVNQNASQFLGLVVKVLTSALCLSRVETVTLQDTADIPYQSGREDPARTVSFDPALNEHTFAVVAGSALELHVLGHSCHQVKIVTPNHVVSEQKRKVSQSSAGRGGAQEDEEGENSRHSPNRPSPNAVAASCAVLTARVQSELDGVALVRHISDEGHQTTQPGQKKTSSSSTSSSSTGRGVVVQALRPGALSVTFSTLRPDSFDGGSAPRRCLCTVRIVVLPNHPVQSVEALELIGFLEEYHVTRVPGSILNAQCFSQQRLDRLAKEVSSDNSDSAVEYYRQHNLLAATAASAQRKRFQHEWTEITRAIAGFGTHTLPVQETATSNVAGQSVLLKEHK